MRARVISSWFVIAAIFFCAIGTTAAQQTTESPVQPPVQPPTQSSGTSASSNDQTASELASGTTICVALAKTIDAKKAKAGDAIAARVTLPVLARGKVLLPNDTKIAGHVVSAKRSHGGGEAELSIVFDRAALKDGSELPLALTVQAIGRSSYSAAETSSQDPYNPDAPLGAGVPGAPNSAPRSPGVPIAQPRVAPTPTAPSGGPDSTRPHPALDTGSHGAVGLPDVTLTESPDATTGSVVKAAKNVKLESGTEMILRVVVADKAKSKD